MSLVTAQGLQARSQLDTEISTLSSAVVDLLADGEQRSPAEIITTFADKNSDTVREAIWRLLDQRIALMTETRKLKLTAQ